MSVVNIQPFLGPAARDRMEPAYDNTRAAGRAFTTIIQRPPTYMDSASAAAADCLLFINTEATRIRLP